MRFVVRLLVNAAALFVATRIVPGVSYSGGVAPMLAVALIFGIVNAVIGTISKIVTFPIIILTLGLFILVINGLLFWFVASFVKGFTVGGFWSAVLGAIVYALVSWAASALVFGPPRVVVVRRDDAR